MTLAAIFVLVRCAVYVVGRWCIFVATKISSAAWRIFFRLSTGKGKTSVGMMSVFVLASCAVVGCDLGSDVRGLACDCERCKSKQQQSTAEVGDDTGKGLIDISD